jgi:hypothetical protein
VECGGLRMGDGDGDGGLRIENGRGRMKDGG